jgi:hypothetical protein
METIQKPLDGDSMHREMIKWILISPGENRVNMTRAERLERVRELRRQNDWLRAAMKDSHNPMVINNYGLLLNRNFREIIELAYGK